MFECARSCPTESIQRCLCCKASITSNRNGKRTTMTKVGYKQDCFRCSTSDRNFRLALRLWAAPWAFALMAPQNIAFDTIHSIVSEWASLGKPVQSSHNFTEISTSEVPDSSKLLKVILSWAPLMSSKSPGSMTVKDVHDTLFDCLELPKARYDSTLHQVLQRASNPNTVRQRWSHR